MVGGKEKITFLLLFLISLSAFAGGDSVRVSRRQHFKKAFYIDYGVKGGFNSSMFLIDNFRVNGTTIEEMQNNYKIGYNVALFTRFNLDRHFIQLTPEFSIINSEITFDKKASQHPDVVPDFATIETHLKTFNVHLLYGYNLIDAKPYGLSIFAGPTLKYIWRDKSRIEYLNFSDAMNETINPFCVNIELGVSVKISYLFLDFAYEVGLSNISRSINEGSVANTEITLDRRNNVLSFSCGFTF